MIVISTQIFFYHDGFWNPCWDVMRDPAPTWEYGLPGNGPMDLVADTGTLSFAVDNSKDNTAGLAGYYSPGHTNCATWFSDGLPVMVVCATHDSDLLFYLTTEAGEYLTTERGERLTTEDISSSGVRFRGYMTTARPTAGVFGEAITEVQCVDWMEYASLQKLGQIAIQTTKRADEALTTALTGFAIQPVATSFAAGVETFASIFNTDDSTKQTMASLFQKLARNEGGGYIYLKGDGTLRFDNRQARLATTAAFALNATGTTPMNELEVLWDRQDIKNRIEVKMYPARVDTGADTVIWKLQKTFSLSAGASLVLTCPYRDPATGARISASAVVSPLVEATHIKFGTADDGTSHDLHTLTFPMVVGGNSAEITLTNTGGTAGYVNFIEILGDGIYTYEPMVLESEDTTSIAAKGERVLAVNLEQITNPNTAKAFATTLLGRYKDPVANIERVRFLANFDSDFAAAALTVEPNTRFSIAEQQTGIIEDYFACKLKFEQVGPQLWVEIVPAPAGAAVNYFVWDFPGKGWDQGYWSF